MATKSKKNTTIKLPDGLELERIKLTPALAQEWCNMYSIEKTTKKRGAVKGMIDDIAAGRWSDIAAISDPIIFGKNARGKSTKPPRLLNGRRRILAVANSDVPIYVYVLRQMPIAAYIDLNGSILKGVPELLKAIGDWNHTSIVSAIAYYAVRVQNNGYNIRRSLKGGSATHASRKAVIETAQVSHDKFCDYADKAFNMSKMTKDRAVNTYARFMWLVNEYGTNSHKAKLNDFCTLFATDPSKESHVKLAANTITERIDRLTPYEPLDAAWTLGVLLKCLTDYVNKTKVKKDTVIDIADVNAALDDWQGRVDIMRVQRP